MNNPPTKLEVLGFVNVCYTFESDERGKNKKLVKRQAPNSHGRFRNITVVYDGSGRPWVRCALLTYKEILELNLLVGGPRAYVPHVNDGGKFLRSRYSQFKSVVIMGPKHKPR